jgi:hypothetical protein
MDDSQPPPSRTVRLIHLATNAAGKADPDPKQCELTQLYAQLVEAIVASREAHQSAGGQPAGDQRIEAIIARINAMLE